MYITIEDFDLTIYNEVSKAIARNQQHHILHKATIALAKIESYISGRYNCAAEFAKTGTARNPLLIKYALDIAVYHLYDIAEAMPTHREKNYDEAIDWLKAISAGKANLSGVEPSLPSDANYPKGDIFMGSQAKRNNSIA